MRSWRVIALFSLTLALAAGGVRAAAQTQDENGAGAWGAGSSRGHVWLVMPGERAGESVVLHAPPRRAADQAYRASAPGTLRVVRRLGFDPVGLGAADDRVTVLAPPRPGLGDAPATGPRALSLRATPTPMSDFWSYEPRGRFLPEPPPPAALEVRGVSAVGGAVVVLGRLGDRWWLAREGESGWLSIELPAEAAVAARLVLTQPAGDGLGVVDPSAPGAWRAWLWREDEGGAAWAPTTLRVADDRSLDDAALYLLGRRWLAARFTPGGLVVTTLGGEREEAFARVDRAPAEAAVAVTGDGGGRMVVVWRKGADAGGVGADDVEIAELSLATGEVMYRGDPVRVSPISATQFRLLAGGLVALAVIALLIVLGPGDTPMVLPEGASLAEPSRRLIATALDLAVAALVCAWVFRVPLVELLTLEVLLAGDGSWVALPATLGAGAAIGTLLEWLVGRTLGKALTGCRVVGVRARDAEWARERGVAARPRLWQAAVRNVVKWALPPVAALALLDASGRHRGGVLSRTAVVLLGRPEAGGE